MDSRSRRPLFAASAARFAAASAAGLFAASLAAASPFSPPALDPAIAAAAAQVSADSLTSYLTALQAFQTRHTNSDTTSATTGIGAARRWVHAKFAEIGAATGNLDASYHDFTATISGITNLHRNVVGEISGTAPPSERRVYILGAHLDTRQEDINIVGAPQFGVDDDGSGIACLLECARVLAQNPPEHTIRFVAFTGEEQGLDGSGRYAADQRVAGTPIAAMIANDLMASITGAPDPDSTAFTDTTLARVFASNPEQGPHRQVQRFLKSIADVYVPIQQLVLVPAEDRPGRGSDHISFVDNGFPAVRLMEYLEELFRQHTALGDTLGPHLSSNYLRRNCMIDLATLAHLADSPASPQGLTAADVGDSTAFRLTWPAHPGEANLTSYLVTARTPGGLDYETVTDVGLAHELVVSSPPGPAMWFGLSAVDAAGHRALVAAEVLGVLGATPQAPANLAATPNAAQIHLDWSPNAEGDLDGYRVYRSTTPGGPYTLLTPSPISTASYDDAAASPHTFYSYVVTAVDTKAKESAFSNESTARLVTLDSGILFVDETRSGGTAWFPSDAVADAAYAAMLAGLPHATWDVDAQGSPALSDLGIYSSVIWAGDDFNGMFNGFPLVTQRFREAEEALAAYMDRGGNVLAAGWEPVHGFRPIEEYPIALAEGDFLFDYFGVAQASLDGSRAFSGGAGEAFFPDVTLDPARLNPAWSGRLARVEYGVAAAGGAEVAYRFDSTAPDSAFHSTPCALFRDGGGYRASYWGFPLYHLKNAEGKAALEAVMTYFGELPPTGAGPGAGGALDFALAQNRPNPFTGSTEIRFAVPAAGAKVTLAVYDVAGRRVRELVRGRVEGGLHTATWDGRDAGGLKVGAGVYFARLEAEGRKLVKRIVALR